LSSIIRVIITNPTKINKKMNKRVKGKSDTMEMLNINNSNVMKNNVADNIVTVKCPYCGSIHAVKNGKKRNRQRYLCRDCKKSFCLADRRIKRNIKERELCLLLYSHNMSLRSIQSVIKKFFGADITLCYYGLTGIRF
jgi:predicted RNA-binding Zn-ribbon protein involved in translation (DUF1610 family)